MTDQKTEEKIRDYVSFAGHCKPSSITLIDDDEQCPIYKVLVDAWGPEWEIPHPKFWYVLTKPFMELYRDDHQTPIPWLPQDEQKEADVLDYLRSFHIGLCLRLMPTVEYVGVEPEEK